MAAIAAPIRGAVGRLSPRAWLIAGASVLVLFGGFMWLRESPLAKIDDVYITGLTSSQEAPAIRRALTDAAQDMTSLHVRVDALRSAVAPFSIVKDVKAEGDFPHKLRIEVIEYHPVAVLDVGGRLLPVAADGTLLRGELASRDLPKVPTNVAPGGSKLSTPVPLMAVRALGAAPASLRPLIARARRGPDGLRIELDNGPQLIFGDDSRAHAKWAAVVRVLADPTSKGATYVDVRVPGRAVAGRFPTDSSAKPVVPVAQAPVAPTGTTAAAVPTPTPTPVPTPATPAAATAQPAQVPPTGTP
jgi:cell division protein FtsQ